MGKFATAINCIDGRVQLPVIEYIKNKYEVDYVDMITKPGPDKILAENKESFVIDSIKKGIEISVNKHNSKLIAIVGHYDCAGNPVDEKMHIKQIRRAIKMVKSWNLNVQVIGVWVNQNWQVEEVRCF